MIKHLILTILIIAIFGNTSRAEQTNIYNKIEDIIIYNDYNMMKSVSREIEREILSVKSVESKIDLQQTLGLLNLHMGNLPKARKLFLKSLEMSIEHFPNDSKKIYSNAFFLLNSNDYLDFDQLDLVPSKILENLLTIHNSESAFFDAAKGCYIMSLNMFDMLEGVYESALEKASEDISNKIRWARLTYMMISDCMISAQMYQGNFEKALNFEKA